MLETTKTTTINGTSRTNDNEVVATMYYTIGKSGTVSNNMNIVNKELYEANKAAVRADIDNFTALCRTEEDAETTE